MSTDLAQTLMEEFADATGVSGTAKPRRYLWTVSVSVRMGTTISGQWEPPGRLRRESFGPCH
jgi:hypothetical protein